MDYAGGKVEFLINFRQNINNRIFSKGPALLKSVKSAVN